MLTMYLTRIQGKTISIEKLIKGPDSTIWKRSLSNELRRLVRGVGCSRNSNERIKGTDTTFFIPHTKVLRTEKVTYTHFICDTRPLKSEKHRVKFTVGGDKLDYEEDARSPAASLLDTQLFLIV